MGRGRQKAKDAKIARQLKYSNHGADLRDLERELIGGSESRQRTPDSAASEETEEYVDRWSDDDR
ncbi:DUF3073 family protein [Demequina globuliformis]|uniref:DUF3073 family protein n=1 Tax=Demequina globuliformis TaxID=676202 RepID=UPI0007817F2B|nr:DUF3073 family protein [Demequina globuliformis]